MRVLHLLKSNKFSGAENVVLTIMDACQDIEMIYASTDGPIRKVVESRGFRFYPLKETSVPMVKKVISELTPDIIHAHDFTMASIAAWAAGDVPVVAHLHNNPLWLKKVCIKSMVFAMALPRIKKVISVSKAIEDEYVFHGLMKNKNIVIGNVVNAEEVYRKAHEDCDCSPVDLVFLGRMSLPKNPLQFCEIVCDIRKQMPNVTARMIGDGEMMPQVMEYIRSHELEEIIEIVGFQSNPYPYLNAGKIMVMPSIWEGFGLAAVEGMCLRKPVVCSDVGGLREIVDESCGAKCKSTDEYRRTLIELMTNNAIYEFKAKNAVQKSMMYTDMNKYAGDICNIYRSIMER